MKEAVVSDSTCLIGLERVGELNILPMLFDPIMIPPEVEREFGNKFSWLQIENFDEQFVGCCVASCGRCR